MNVINQSGILAIATSCSGWASSLKRRLPDLQGQPHRFWAKWFPVIYTLHFGLLGVVELAAEIGYTHPSTISLLKELEKEKIIRSKKDKQDERKRLIQLTEKGKNLLEQMQPVWKNMISALEELTNTSNNIMKAIAEVEENLSELQLFERVKRQKGFIISTNIWAVRSRFYRRRYFLLLFPKPHSPALKRTILFGVFIPPLAFNKKLPSQRETLGALAESALGPQSPQENGNFSFTLQSMNSANFFTAKTGFSTIGSFANLITSTLGNPKSSPNPTAKSNNNPYP